MRELVWTTPFTPEQRGNGIRVSSVIPVVNPDPTLNLLTLAEKHKSAPLLNIVYMCWTPQL
ncbi:hypothetical protein SISNIDRAFT_452154 [Sistotremastrum niveocremeum HHB9708]|uniref:Uncharacterized protein n=1 Tax=Sistotremastrum niveocremeum HHB9708 TaxID=1314777 RepID=A0A164WZD3_9AGAM|nr:hypothetical protein SISNIDRAFT_452154 [Sistotremastrum niveocremeum HHB9708]